MADMTPELPASDPSVPEPGAAPEPGGPGPDAPDPNAPGPDTSGSEDSDPEGLPADLDPSRGVGSYRFPDNSRRRIAGGLYVILGAATLGAAVALDGSVWVNSGLVIAAAALILVGLYYIQAGWPLSVDEGDALVAATRAVGFPVGHASARLGWRGLRSRPTWRILLYSDDYPPAQRGIVLVDGVDGGVVAHFTEANPEDWSEITGDGAAESGATGEDSAEGGADSEGVIDDDEMAEGAAPSGDDRSDSGPEGR